MGLDFISIPDEEGAALFILHTGNTVDLERLQRLADEVRVEASHQILFLDVASSEGEQFRSFYEIEAESLPGIFIVDDDDSILYQWLGAEIPSSGGDIAYQLNQVN